MTNSRQFWTGPLTFLMLCLVSSAPAQGGPGKVLEKALKTKKGTYFLKSNLPYVSGRHPFGVYKKPLVMCSAEGLNTQQAGEFGAGWYNAEGRTMSLRINDQVKVEDFDYDDDENQLEIELEGTGRTAGGEAVVAFVRLGGVEESTAAGTRSSRTSRSRQSTSGRSRQRRTCSPGKSPTA